MQSMITLYNMSVNVLDLCNNSPASQPYPYINLMNDFTYTLTLNNENTKKLVKRGRNSA